ncbi:MAG: polyphosphate:AMP phosphotransferase [Phycisphaerales bacterium]|nr:MAG: polyphosphate:AMP phosphotransferase [Phycisphaerales bacterium]
MFKTAELGQKIAKAEYHALLPDLRARLVQAQYRMRKADFSVIIVISGNDSVGREQALHTLAEWMDPRFLEINAFGHRSDEERERPRYWRYWRQLPADGRSSIFYGSWVRRPLMDRLDDLIDDEQLDDAIHHVNNFERMLVDDGTILLKFWLHLGRDGLKKRIKAADKDPDSRWKINQRDRMFAANYERCENICKRFVRKTSTAEAPWQIVESTDHRFRNVTIGRAVLDAMTRGMAAWGAKCAEQETATSKIAAAEGADQPINDTRSILDTLDLSRSLDRRQYQKNLESCQSRLYDLGQKAFAEGVSSVLVFEGWDASGKGGAIRRLLAGLDPRDYRVVSVTAPSDEELARHYLWRFWRHLPRAGKVVVFDRSWYGRVLVERVEGLATEEQWRRAYKEINDFEEELVNHGTVLLKFWMHVDRDEQLARFKAREATPFKQHKITEEDFRNREKWDLYEAAVNEMVQRTSTEYAPWQLIEGNDKRYARVEVIRTYVEALEKRLEDLKT